MGRTSIATLIFAVFTTAPCLAQAEGAQHCGLLQATSLPMHLDSQGGPVISASVDDKDIAMLVDTGGVYSMLTDAAARELSLRTVPIDPGIYYLAQSGQTLSRSATAQSFAIGRVKLNHYTFLLLPSDKLSDGTRGVLGPDIMRRFDVEFDFANGKFNLFSHDHCEGKVVYWADDYAVLPLTIDESGHIVANATLDDKAVKVLIDTGSTRSSMTVKEAHDRFGFEAISFSA
ncbi:MAG: pepsin/retropepsin-like aspartic protease family protein [Rhizomicrobium sp.]